MALYLMNNAIITTHAWFLGYEAGSNVYITYGNTKDTTSENTSKEKGKIYIEGKIFLHDAIRAGRYCNFSA